MRAGFVLCALASGVAVAACGVLSGGGDDDDDDDTTLPSPDAGPGGDASEDGAGDAASEAGEPASEVACDDGLCTNGLVCCRSDDGGAGACTTLDECNVERGKPILCDEAADCPGRICCANVSDGYHFESAACAPTCSPDAGIVVCRLGSTECGAKSCVPLRQANGGTLSDEFGLYGCEK